mgnify:CR=1 FL=1|tara:strand:+ start:1398 stop:2099 length:702 start_codon:yes stop_codon:yes gene_type:complete
MTKIYCDIADISLINKYKKKKIVRGFTTNPSLIRKAKAKNYEEYCKKILNNLKKLNKSISLEVLADDEKNMMRQALQIHSWDKNIYIKIPVINSKGEFQGKLINTLNKKKIKLNITAVYGQDQVKQILKKIDKKTKVIISIFAGRLSESGKDPVQVFKKSIKFAKKYKNAEILWASTREVYNYIQAKQLKCHIITMPPDMIKKIENFGSSTKELSLKTVKTFLSDSKKSNFFL